MDTNDEQESVVSINDINVLIFEYDQLRREIRRNDDILLQTLAATLVFTGAIMGLATAAQALTPLLKGFLFLAASTVSIIGLLQTSDRARSTFVTASYLRTFIEPKLPNLKWETRLQKFRTVSPQIGFGRFINFQIWTYVGIILINFGLGVVYVLAEFEAPIPPWFLTPPISYVVIALPFAFGVFVIWAIRRAIEQQTNFVFKHDQTIGALWQKIKHEEEEKERPE